MSDREFARASIALVRRSIAIGLDAALDEQIDNPTLHTPEWSRMVVSLRTGHATSLGDPWEGRCAKCSETGYQTREDEQGIVYGSTCDCSKGRRMAAARAG